MGRRTKKCPGYLSATRKWYYLFRTKQYLLPFRSSPSPLKKKKIPTPSMSLVATLLFWWMCHPAPAHNEHAPALSSAPRLGHVRLSWHGCACLCMCVCVCLYVWSRLPYWLPVPGTSAFLAGWACPHNQCCHWDHPNSYPVSFRPVLCMQGFC